MYLAFFKYLVTFTFLNKEITEEMSSNIEETIVFIYVVVHFKLRAIHHMVMCIKIFLFKELKVYIYMDYKKQKEISPHFTVSRES